MVCDSLHIICGNCGSLLTIGNQNNEKARASVDRDYEGNLEMLILMKPYRHKYGRWL